MKEIEQIYRKYFEHVYRYVYAISKDPNVAEDVTAETFLKAIKGISSFQGKCDIRVWLCQIAKFTYYNQIRKEKHEAVLSLDVMDPSSLEEVVCMKEQHEMVLRIVEQMKPTSQQIFCLRVYNELSFKEIGETFSKSENWACVTFYRIRQKIKEEMRLIYEDNM